MDRTWTSELDIDVVTRGGAGRQIAMCMDTYLLTTYGFATSMPWILQDHRRTEMRGYGVGGNEKGHATLAKWPNKGNAD